MAPTKRGLCWPVENNDSSIPFTRPGSKISWLYNWSPHAPSPSISSLPFIPMQWNDVDASSLSNNPALIRTSSNSDSEPFIPPTLLGFNEPELASQSALSPTAAAETWLTHIQPLRAQGVRVGSPGIASTEAGITWLHEFLKLVRTRGSDVDFWCLHWYGEGLGSFYDWIWSTHHRLGPEKPVWITEFAVTNWNADNPLSKDVVEGFLRESVKYLDGLDWVERYAWFGPMRDTGTVGKWAALMDGQGGISELGKIYRDL